MKTALMTLFFLPMLFSGCSYLKPDKLINGMQAPVIELPGAGGEMLSLSALRGSVVLVEFWASWCKPCREQNPKIVALYEKYRNTRFKNANGLKVFSVSLDSDKDRWLQAIRNDNLHWEHHVCDLKGWKSSAAADYGVASIPASFLIDAEGVIIGKDLKPRDLDKLLGFLAE